MSVETKAVLDAAIAAHVADECDGEMVTGWVLQTCGTRADYVDESRTGYLRVVADGQVFTTSLGLATYLHAQMMNAALPGEGD